MDRGAHFNQCDFQVHTPRDLRWTGSDATSDEERLAYGKTLVSACREKKINAVAITDHHDMTFVPFIRQAALEETRPDGSLYGTGERLIVFPGMELTLGVPCQALLIFDADFPNDMFSLALTALAISQNGADQPKIRQVQRLDHIQNLKQLKDELDKHEYLRGRYIVFPNVTDERQFSLLRRGQAGKYSEMPWVGGYSDGEYSRLGVGARNILAGKDAAWGNKRVACIQTSDTRRFDHTTLGQPSTWIKWAQPSAEALRQACLAQESRIALDIPRVPETFIAMVSVSNSNFLGPLDLEMNPQYSALIGGRGTGKSSLLEYIRWALCDQPPNSGDEDAPNYQQRRSRLIESTLRPLGATVQVQYILNGVQHIVRRASSDGAIQLKVGANEFKSCTEEDIRTLLPIQAYSQKQLSDVSVRIDELTRFITSPIKGELDLLRRKIADRANRIRELYATRQRYRELTKALNNRTLEEKSIAEQADAIRASLTGLSDVDKSLLDQGKVYSVANNAVDAWKVSSGALRQRGEELKRAIQLQVTSLAEPPDEPAELNETLRQARASYQQALQIGMEGINEFIEALAIIEFSTAADENNPWRKWETAYAAFQGRYTEALQRSSSQAEKLTQLSALEAQISSLAQESTRTRELLAALGSSDANYLAARQEWLNAQHELDDLLDRECDQLTSRSGGAIRVKVKRHAVHKKFSDILRQSLAGSRIQMAKSESIGESIVSSKNPREQWMAILDELEVLADYDKERSSSDGRMSTPRLTGSGLTAGDLDRIAQTLTPENWLGLSLTPIESIPVYEFQARENEYIPFENASAGQQATALLKTLLNQPGPPLIVDQPEEDLDNPVMLEIVEQLWEAKKLRQVIFASHNANLVVNGDAELVAWFGYRAAGDQSRGMIKGEGAIDVPEVREAIKKIMEGGEAAFRLRREKYGF